MFPRPESHPFAQMLHRVGVEKDKKPYLHRLNGRTMSTSALGYVVKGSGWFESHEHGRQSFGPGTLLVQPASVWHSHDPDTVWTEYWIMYRAEAIAPLFGDLAPRGIGARTIGVRSDVIALWDDLYAAWPAFGAGSLERACLLMHRLLFAVQQALTVEANTRDPEWMQEADSRIRALVRVAAFDPEQLARRLKVPYHTFRRDFRRHMGVAPKQYWLRLRMERAVECLANTGLSVGETATYLGFDDPCYFTRVFTRIIGVAPGRYRASV